MPSSRVFSFDDPYAYQTSIRASTKVEVFPTSKGDFRADLMQIDLNYLWMQRGNESLPRIARAAVNEERAAIEFPTKRDQPALRHRGIDVAPGEIVVNDVDDLHRVSVGPSHWGAMSLTPDDLAAAGRAIVGRELTRPSVMRVIRPAPALMARLLKLHGEAAKLAWTSPEKIAHAQVARSLEQALTHAMVMCLSEDAVEVKSGRHHHSSVIARFEDFLAANRYEAVYLAEICAAIGVSERTLRVCCHEHLGMGPIRYLWLRRMHLARRALVLADPATATVTEIATGYGFWELGRFSVEYRALFGESPSASLHRPPETWRTYSERPSMLPDSELG